MAGMKSLKKQRRIQVIIVAFTCIFAMLGLFWVLPADAFALFRSPSQVLAEPPAENELFRIGGMVEEGTIVRGEGTQVSFSVTDGGASVPVVFDGILPDLFDEGQGMVGQGHYVNGTFQAVEILAKHDEDYMPAELVDSLKEQGVYKEPDAGAAIN
jgi:cytochrome c-type biogenesis protein CcmE